jgi:PAS domain S-box-containing protein
VLGYPPAERVDRSAFELVHPEDLPDARRAFARSLQSPGLRLRTMLRVRHRDGSWRDAEVDAVNRLDEPAVGGVVVNFRDVTERRRAGEERERSRSLLAATLESTADGILVVDSEGRIAIFNQKFVRMWRIPEEVMASGDHERALDSVHEQLEDPPGFLSRVRAIYARAEAESFDTLRFRDGRVFERYSQAQRVGEKVVGRVWSFRDVTERTRAEEAMSRLVAILEATTDFVGVADLEGRVLYVNRAGRRMVGLGEEEDLSPTRIEQYYPDWAGRVVMEEAVPAALKAGVWSGETALLDREGREIPVLQLVLAHRSPGGGVEYLSTIARDISQRKQSEEALRRSETMAALGSLVAGVAHEVRNPLFGISSTLDAFEARFGGSEGQGRYVAVLREQLERLNGLMNDLLEYGKPARLELAEGSVEEVIGEAMGACRALAERAGVELVNGVGRGLPAVRMERARLVQVFRNLIENAVQFSPRGGAVRVGAERAGREGGWCVECTVEDTGPGIAPGDLPRLFEPFFTRRRGGTGLGLSIVQRIVEEHGGTLTAANRPSRGAVMKVAIPCAGSPAAAP